MSADVDLWSDPGDREAMLAGSRSTPGKTYRITNIEGLWPRCDCPAGTHGAECGHVLALLELQQKGTEMAETTATGTTAVMRTSAPVTTRALQVRETLAAVRGGFDEALFVAEKVIGRAAWPEELQKDPNGAPRAALIVMTAAELGVSPVQAFSYITTIKGKPFLMARMVNALVSARVPGGYIVPKKRGPLSCIVVAHRPGRPDVEVEITIDMARKAGWTTNRLYESNPAAMLTARATTTAGWLQFPDVLAGMDAADEVEGTTVPFFAAEVEAVPASAVTEPVTETPVPTRPAANLEDEEGEYRDLTPESLLDEATAEEEGMGDDEFIAACLRELEAEESDWGKAAALLGIKKSRAAFCEWRHTVGDGGRDAIEFLSRRLRQGRGDAQQPELLG